MPEKDPVNGSSGIVPGDAQAVRHPTAMPSGGPPQKPVCKPTIIVGAVPAQRRPTAMPGSPKPQANVPTAMPHQDAPLTVAQKAPVVVTMPTAMSGVRRKRISVTAADVMKANPSVDPTIVSRVVDVVSQFSPDTATDGIAILWGTKLQQQYGELMSKSLKLSQSKELSNTSGHIARMISVLGSIKIGKIFKAKPQGFFARALAKASDEIDSPEELEGAQREIEMLVELVNKSIDPLLILKTEAENLSVEIERVRVEAEVLAAAALVIAGYFTSMSQAGLAQRFIERSMSLTMTCAQIQSNSSIRTAQIEQPLQLIGVVQNVVLITLPGLIGSIAALQTMMKSSNKPTVTHVNELGNLITQTIESLKV